MKKVEFAVEGMKCGGCASKIETALKGVGASAIETLVEQKIVRAQIPADRAGLEFKKAIEKSGGFKVLSINVSES